MRSIRVEREQVFLLTLFVSLIKVQEVQLDTCTKLSGKDMPFQLLLDSWLLIKMKLPWTTGLKIYKLFHTIVPIAAAGVTPTSVDMIWRGSREGEGMVLKKWKGKEKMVVVGVVTVTLPLEDSKWSNRCIGQPSNNCQLRIM